MNTWIKFRVEYEEGIIDRVRLPFNSRMTDIFQGSNVTLSYLEEGQNTFPSCFSSTILKRLKVSS